MVYQYLNYMIQLSSNGDYLVRNSSGKVIVRCESDKEAEEYVDSMIESSYLRHEVLATNEYYVCRISKFDEDNLNNYQY